jgi:hypothetical protein
MYAVAASAAPRSKNVAGAKKIAGSGICPRPISATVHAAMRWTALTRRTCDAERGVVPNQREALTGGKEGQQLLRGARVHGRGQTPRPLACHQRRSRVAHSARRRQATHDLHRRRRHSRRRLRLGGIKHLASTAHPGFAPSPHSLREHASTQIDRRVHTARANKVIEPAPSARQAKNGRRGGRHRIHRGTWQAKGHGRRGASEGNTFSRGRENHPPPCPPGPPQKTSGRCAAAPRRAGNGLRASAPPPPASTRRRQQ